MSLNKDNGFVLSLSQIYSDVLNERSTRKTIFFYYIYLAARTRYNNILNCVIHFIVYLVHVQENDSLYFISQNKLLKKRPKSIVLVCQSHVTTSALVLICLDPLTRACVPALTQD